MQHSILVIDDEKDIRTSLTGILEDEGYQVTCADSGQSGIESAVQDMPDLVLLDIWMPGMDGLETLELLKKKVPQLVVIMISGHGTIETAVKATKLGAYDFIEKPLSLEKVLISVNNALQLQELKSENAELKRTVTADAEIIGEDQTIVELRNNIERIAMVSSPVLLYGESGTGKELSACSLHCNSPRRERPFVKVHCAALPEELIESELFGHEKGAFNSAMTSKKGRIDQADGGTLFLDDIDCLPLSTQIKLYDFLHNGTFERVGGNRRTVADVRIIAATTKNPELLSGGPFYQELLDELSTILISLSPLRERKDDISSLVNFFVARFFKREGGETKAFMPDALGKIIRYSWPGNVRELKNVIERILIVAPGRIISEDDIPQLSGHDDFENAENCTTYKQPFSVLLRNARESFEKEFIIEKLEENEWNISKTAELIGLERSNLHRKIKNYGITAKK